jgi:COX assembly protein 1
MIYACRQPRLAMNSCMLQYQNQDELDKARLEWFALAGERRKVCLFHFCVSDSRERREGRRRWGEGLC